jgi:hypothetical protein
MAITVTVTFNPIAPIPGENFAKLRVRLVDGGGTARIAEFPAAHLQANATVNPDGSYSMPVPFATVGVGAYTVQAQAINTAGAPYGAIANGSGSVSLADGVWIPSPVAVA